MNPNPPLGPGSQVRSELPLLVIHIGTHKTGTTSLQDFLWARRGDLRDAGYVYPAAALFGTQHAGLPASYMPDHPALPRTLLDRDPRQVVDEIAAAVPSGANAILSSEVFWELATYLRPNYESMVDMLRQRWNVRVVYLSREPHQKAWSSVKHMARQGWAFDPVATYRADIASTRQTEEFIRTVHPSVARLRYEGGDSVRKFLQFLTSDEIAATAGTNMKQVAALHAIMHRRGRPSIRKQGNRDYSSPISAAVTLGISRALADHVSAQYSVPIPELPRLYTALFRAPALTTSLGLPSAGSLESRIREESTTTLLGIDELRALSCLMSTRRVRIRASIGRSSAPLAAVNSLLT